MSDAVATTVQYFLDECADLDAMVADLPAEQWRRETPAAGWTVAHQIAHLSWTDEVALLAATDRDAFALVVEEAGEDVPRYVDRGADEGAASPVGELLARWRGSREALANALREAGPGTKFPWFGPGLSPRSMATARLMEVWAHGQDVADALGVERAATARLRDVCHLGVRTRDFAYRINGLEPPAREFRVELTGPDASTWSWGPEDAADRVTGSAVDFCLVVTQRRELHDTALIAQGRAAEWLTFAQAFAGPPTSVGRGRD